MTIVSTHFPLQYCMCSGNPVPYIFYPTIQETKSSPDQRSGISTWKQVPGKKILLFSKPGISKPKENNVLPMDKKTDKAVLPHCPIKTWQTEYFETCLSSPVFEPAHIFSLYYMYYFFLVNLFYIVMYLVYFVNLFADYFAYSPRLSYRKRHFPGPPRNPALIRIGKDSLKSSFFPLQFLL